jgi:hypothetical protein
MLDYKHFPSYRPSISVENGKVQFQYTLFQPDILRHVFCSHWPPVQPRERHRWLITVERFLSLAQTIGTVQIGDRYLTK